MKLPAIFVAVVAAAAAPAALGAACGVSFLHFPQKICGAQLYWENTYLLLHTRPGERVMRPELGVDWQDLCFGPNTPAAVTAMEARIAQQVEANVGLAVRSVKIAPDPADPATLAVTVVYADPDSGKDAAMTVPYRCGDQG